MKILHCCEFYAPHVGGMPEVVRQLSEAMVFSGQDVTVATSAHLNRPAVLNGVKIIDFEISGNAVFGVEAKASELERFETLIRSEEFDVIVLFAAQQWTFDIPLLNLAQIRSKVVIVPTGFSALYNSNFAKFYDLLRAALPLVDHGIFLSSDYRDINFVKNAGFDRFSVIPNGAALQEFAVAPKLKAGIRTFFDISPETRIVLSVGSHTGLKGHREAIESYTAADFPESVFLIVGNAVGGCEQTCLESAKAFNKSKSAINSKRKIIIASLSRELTIDAYFQSDIFLFLSNIECSPIVLFEACAAGKPFISSDAGNSKEISKWLENGVVCETDHVVNEDLGAVSASVISATKFLETFGRDRSQLTLKAEHSRKLWRENYTWEAIANRYLDVYVKTERAQPALEDYRRFSTALGAFASQQSRRNGDANKLLLETMTSRSWKITAPLRKVTPFLGIAKKGPR